jgi:V/A-type H+-transporting ATPase subunit E
MSIEKIIEKISLEAGDKAESIRKAAEDETKHYLKKANEAALAEKAARINSGKREVDAEVSRMLAQARMEGRKKVRDEKERLISECFDLAGDEIKAVIESNEYPRILGYLIRDGIEKIGADNIIISANSRDIPILEAVVAREQVMGASIKISDIPIRTMGGVLLKTISGARIVNNTFEARLERMRRDLIFEVAGILAGEEGGLRNE